MAEQISAWIILIAAIAAVWLLIDYWRIRRAHPDLFSKWTAAGNHEDEDRTISGRPRYWEPGNLDARNPSEMDRPHWSN